MKISNYKQLNISKLIKYKGDLTMSLAKQLISTMESLRHSHATRKETIQIERNNITYAVVDEVAESLTNEGYQVIYEIGVDTIYFYITW